MLGSKEINQIKNVLRMSINNNYIAGANLLVIKNGEEIFYHEDGFADIKNEVRIKRNSIFRLYSMTKPITAAAVMILLERGEIDLYEPVSKFLSGFKNQMVDTGEGLIPVEREVMIKDLLSMTSGLVYGGENQSGKNTEELFKKLDKRLFTDKPISTKELINELGKCSLAFQPGSSWNYGTSADVLGAVIEVVTEKKFGEFLKEQLFNPLEMTDTDFWVPKNKRNRLANAYEQDENNNLKIYTGNNLGIINNMDRNPAFQSGGAGLASTIDDYAKFANMLMNRGNYNNIQILKPHTVKYMTSSTLNSMQQQSFDNWITLCGHSYGNLMRIMIDTRKAGDLASNDEYGWDGWLGPYFCNCPNDKLTLLFMMQKTDAGTSNITRKIRNIILSSCCE